MKGVGSCQNTTTYAAAGKGGNAGNATTRLVSSTINGTEQADSLTLGLSATGGRGGPGGRGGSAVASQSSTSGDPNFVSTSTTVGTTAGLKGNDGITGLATLEVRGNGSAGERAATIDVANGTLRLDSTPVLNTLRGFEVFTATDAADRIIDGGGNQEYRGGNGTDRYTFSAGHAGNDVIGDFSAADRIVYSGFGSPLDSIADVLNATTQTSGGAQITTSGSSSALLAGFAKASLTSAMVSFL
jgi:hypothetical protein